MIWRVHGSIIRDEDGTQIAEAGSKEIAQQIVREHNAQEELILITNQYRTIISCLSMRQMQGVISELKKIDAVLAQVEGEE